MAERDYSGGEILFSDVPGDSEKVRSILAEWGLGERAIRRLIDEQRGAQTEAAEAPVASPPRSPAPPARFVRSK